MYRMMIIVIWKLVSLSCSRGRRRVCRQNLAVARAAAARVNTDQPRLTRPRSSHHRHHADITGDHMYARSRTMTLVNR